MARRPRTGRPIKRTERRPLDAAASAHMRPARIHAVPLPVRPRHGNRLVQIRADDTRGAETRRRDRQQPRAAANVDDALHAVRRQWHASRARTRQENDTFPAK